MEQNNPLFTDDLFEDEFPEFDITDTNFVAERDGTEATFKYDDNEQITKVEIDGEVSELEYNGSGSARFELDGREYTISKPRSDSERPEGYVIREAVPSGEAWLIVGEVPYNIEKLETKTIALRDGDPITLHYCEDVSAYENPDTDKMKSVYLSYRDNVANVSAKEDPRPGNPSDTEYYRIGSSGIEKVSSAKEASDAKDVMVGVSIIAADKHQTGTPPKIEIIRYEDGEMKDITNYDMHTHEFEVIRVEDIGYRGDAVESDQMQDAAPAETERTDAQKESAPDADRQQRALPNEFEKIKDLPEIRNLIETVLDGRPKHEKEAILTGLNEQADRIVTAEDFAGALKDSIATVDKNELNKDVETLKSLGDRPILTADEKIRIEKLSNAVGNIEKAIDDHKKDDLKSATADMLKETRFGDIVKSFVAGKIEAHSEMEQKKLEITKEEKDSGVSEKWFGEKGSVISRCEKGNEIFRIDYPDGKQKSLTGYENGMTDKAYPDAARKEFGTLIDAADRITNLTDTETATESFGIELTAREESGYDVEREHSAGTEKKSGYAERDGAASKEEYKREDLRSSFEEKVKDFKEAYNKYREGMVAKYEVINAGIDAIGHCKNPLLIRVAVEEILASRSYSDLSRDNADLGISENERKEGVYYKTFGENGAVISLFDGGCKWEFGKRVDGAVSKIDYENGAKAKVYEDGKREMTVKFDKLFYRVETTSTGDMIVKSENADFRLGKDITESDGEKYVTLFPKSKIENPISIRLDGSLKDSADFREKIFDFFSKTDERGARAFIGNLADKGDMRIEIPNADIFGNEKMTTLENRRDEQENLRDAKDIARMLWEIVPRDSATKIAENAKSLMDKGWSPEKAFESSFDKAVEEGWIRDDKNSGAVQKYNEIYDKIENYNKHSRTARDTFGAGMEIKRLIQAKNAGVPITVGGTQRMVTTGDIVSSVLRFTQSNIFETLIWNAVVSIADAVDPRDPADKNVEDTEKNRSERSPADVEEMKSDVEKSIDRQNADKPDNDDIDKKARGEQRDTESKTEKDINEKSTRTDDRKIDREADKEEKESRREIEQGEPNANEAIENEPAIEIDRTNEEDEQAQEDAASRDAGSDETEALREFEKKPNAAELEESSDHAEISESLASDSPEKSEYADEQDTIGEALPEADKIDDDSRWGSDIAEEIGQRQDSPEFDYEKMQSDMIDRTLRDPSDEDRLEELRSLLQENLPDEFDNESFDQATEDLSKEIVNEPVIENNYNSVEQGEGEFGDKLYSDGDVFDSYTGAEVEPAEIDIERTELDDRFSQQIEQTVGDVDADMDMIEKEMQNDTEIDAGNDTEAPDADLFGNEVKEQVDASDGLNGDLVIDDSINTEYAELPDMQGDDIRFDESVDMDAQPSDASSMDDCETGEDIAELIASIIA